jgi:hypothetical protein
LFSLSGFGVKRLLVYGIGCGLMTVLGPLSGFGLKAVLAVGSILAGFPRTMNGLQFEPETRCQAEMLVCIFKTEGSLHRLL